jgi:hypothetical protein
MANVIVEPDTAGARRLEISYAADELRYRSVP